MKIGLLMHQAPPSFGRNPIVAPESLASFWSVFKVSTKKQQFIEKLNEKLAELDESVTVVEDSTEANLEEIAKQDYDFIICTPGLEKRVVPSQELPSIFYIDSLDYQETTVEPVIQKIKKEGLGTYKTNH